MTEVTGESINKLWEEIETINGSCNCKEAWQLKVILVFHKQKWNNVILANALDFTMT